jgi:hypothetical protein
MTGATFTHHLPITYLRINYIFTRLEISSSGVNIHLLRFLGVTYIVQPSIQSRGRGAIGRVIHVFLCLGF